MPSRTPGRRSGRSAVPRVGAALASSPADHAVRRRRRPDRRPRGPRRPHHARRVPRTGFPPGGGRARHRRVPGGPAGVARPGRLDRSRCPGARPRRDACGRRGGRRDDVDRRGRRAPRTHRGLGRRDLSLRPGRTRPRRARRTAPAPLDASDRLVEEYVRTEILASTSPEDADLLLRASVLERDQRPAVRRGPRAERLGDGAGSPGAREPVPDPARPGPDLVPLPSPARRPAPRRARPARPRRARWTIRRRAAAWHEDQGLLEPALEYAIAGSRSGSRRRACWRGSVQATLNAGRSETIRRWFGWFEERGAWTHYPGSRRSRPRSCSPSTGISARSDRWWNEAGLEDPGEPTPATALCDLRARLPVPGRRRADARRCRPRRRRDGARRSVPGRGDRRPRASRWYSAATSTAPRPS